MRTLAAAIAVLVLASGASTATRPTPRTLVTERGPIHALAQDTNAVAWIGPGYLVHVRKLSAGRGSVIGDALQRGGPVRITSRPLALAGTRALWTSYDGGNFLEVHVHTGSPTQADKDIYELDYMPGPADGSWLGGTAGHGSTLVFGATSQRCDVEWNCRRLDVEGAVQRVDTRVHELPGIPPSFLLATSADRVAVVPAKTPRFFPDIGPPRAAEYAPVQVYDLAGRLISSVTPDGTPRAIALAWPKLAVLFEFVDGTRQIQLYDARTGAYWSSGGEGVRTRVPATVTRVSVGVPGAVYSVGKTIYLLRKQQPQLLWRAAGAPIGLSIEGRRVVWAENVGGHGRIRVVTVR